MEMKLSQAKVRDLRPGKKEYLVHDTGQTGLLVRVRPSGGKSFAVMYRNADGRLRRYTIAGTDQINVTEARKLAAAKMAEAKHGKDPQAVKVAKRSEPTVAEMVAAWEDHIGPSKKPSTRRRYAQLHAEIVEHIGSKRALSVTRADVAGMHREVSKTRPTTANRLYERMRALWNTCRDDLGLLPEDAPNPARKISKNSEEPRRRVLSDDEWEAIEAAALATRRIKRQTAGALSRAKSDAVLFLLYRGLRRSEACMLKWEHVDLERRVLTIEGTKTGTIQIALDDATYGLLAERAEHSDPEVPWVFPTGTGNMIEPEALSKAFKRVCKEAGVEGVALHDLRRTWVTTAVGEGVPLEAAGRAVGHRSPQTTARYFQPGDSASMAVANAVASKRRGNSKRPVKKK